MIVMRWMDGRTGGWVGRWMGAWVVGWVTGWVVGWMSERLAGWVDGGREPGTMGRTE